MVIRMHSKLRRKMEGYRRTSNNVNHPVRITKNNKIILTNEASLRNAWDNIKHTHIFIIGVSEKEEGERGTGNLFEEVMKHIDADNSMVLIRSKRGVVRGNKGKRGQICGDRKWLDFGWWVHSAIC